MTTYQDETPHYVPSLPLGWTLDQECTFVESPCRQYSASIHCAYDTEKVTFDGTRLRPGQRDTKRVPAAVVRALAELL